MPMFMIVFFLLKIRNGETAESPLVGTYCGSMPPPPIQSTGSSLRLRFKSNSIGRRNGFRIRYNTSPSGGGGAGGVNATSTTISGKLHCAVLILNYAKYVNNDDGTRHI